MSIARSKPITSTEVRDGLLLRGLDGANPLGFLAALGTLQTISTVNPLLPIMMSWSDDSFGCRPSIHGFVGDVTSLSDQIARHLNCPFHTDESADNERVTTLKHFEVARRWVREAEDKLKKSGLKGDDRKAEEKRVLEPLREEMADFRSKWLGALEKCVPSLELSLGKHLNATCGELRDASLQALSQAGVMKREIVDLLASFGSDACRARKGDGMQPTAFCFITGSGHQYFLDTVLQLTAKLDAKRFELALSQNAEARDERLSMRWDPLEDRRYALMWSDPTSSDNVAKTNWALNLLAYRGLVVIPSVPTAKGLRTTGWTSQREPRWTWPIWRGCASASMVRSLLAHPVLAAEPFDLKQINGLGIRAVYRSTRIQVGNPPLHKLNFTPAHRIG